jgi:hypothetical protein
MVLRHGFPTEHSKSIVSILFEGPDRDGVHDARILMLVQSRAPCSQ